MDLKESGDHPVILEPPVTLVFLEPLERQDLRDLLEPPELLAHLDPLDHPASLETGVILVLQEKRATLDPQVLMDQLDQQETRERWDPRDPLVPRVYGVHKVPQESREREERREMLALKDLVVCPDLWVDQDQGATGDPLGLSVLQEWPETRERLVQLVSVVRRVATVPRDHLAHKDLSAFKDPLDHLVLQARKDHVVCRDLWDLRVPRDLEAWLDPQV